MGTEFLQKDLNYTAQLQEVFRRQEGIERSQKVLVSHGNTSGSALGWVANKRFVGEL